MGQSRGGLGTKLALLAITTIASLLALEAAVRVLIYSRQGQNFDDVVDAADRPTHGAPAVLAQMIRRSELPDVIYELHPGLDVRFKNRRVVTNSRGYRSPEVDTRKPPGTYRILGIGDSIMFGWGVEHDETYLALLQKELERRNPDRSWEVVNTAVPGYNTAMEVATLESRGLDLEPDLVVLGFCGNDFQLPNFLWTSPTYLTLGRSFLFDFLKEILGSEDSTSDLGHVGIQHREQLLRGDPDEVNLVDRVPPQYQHLVGWKSFEAAIERLADLSQSRGFRVVATIFGVSDDPQTRQVVKALDHLGIEVVDLGPPLRAYMSEHGIKKLKGSPLTLSAVDQHPSPLSHRLAATELLALLIALDRQASETP